MRSDARRGASERLRTAPRRKRGFLLPITPPRETMLKDRFEAGLTMQEFVDCAEEKAGEWRAAYADAHVPKGLVKRASRLHGTYRLLVLMEDWCVDGPYTMPPLARLAEASPRLELRVASRDANPDLMAEHRTGGAWSIPVVMVLDEQWTEVGWWGPRPAELQEWMRGPKARDLEPHDLYRKMRRWYEKNGAEPALEEILGLLEQAAAARAA